MISAKRAYDLEGEAAWAQGFDGAQKRRLGGRQRKRLHDRLVTVALSILQVLSTRYGFETRWSEREATRHELAIKVRVARQYWISRCPRRS